MNSDVLCYRMLRRILALIVLRRRREVAYEIELLALRHCGDKGEYG